MKEFFPVLRSSQLFSGVSEEELTAIDDVGPITAGYIRQWVESPQSRDLLERLRAAGVNMTCREEQTDRRFAGMTFVLTGALEKFTREEAGGDDRAPGAARPPPRCPKRPPMWWREPMPVQAAQGAGAGRAGADRG